MAPIVKAPGTPPLPELTMTLARTLRRPSLALAIALALPLSLMASVSASAAPAAAPPGQDLPYEVANWEGEGGHLAGAS